MHGTRGLALPAVLALSLMTAAGVHAFLRKPANLKNTRPEMWMSTPQLIKTNGLEPETHTVKTEDGYILVAHRIAHGRRSNATNPTPVLMGHGLCSSDEQWVFRGKDQHNLVYTLADMGFDVWLANYRGSFYSRRHATLDAKSHEFWDFSWHENGVYDQSALIDYVLKVTGKESLIVLGHSMSSTSQLVLLAERPEYSGKVRASILLAPPAYFAHASGFLGIVNMLFKSMPFLRDATSQNLINDKFSGLDRPFPQACLDRIGKINARVEPFCSRLFEQALGKLHTPIDMDLLRLVLHHYPAGSSIRQVMHYAQCIDAGGRFIKYDFGPEKNREKYGVPFAPEYNLSRIASPLYLHYSVGDGTVNYKDVEAFARNLSPGVLKKLRKIPSDTFNHVDYLIASDVNELLYKDVIEDLLKHV